MFIDTQWLAVRRGKSPLILSMPHVGSQIPAEFAVGLRSVSAAQRDTDWWIDKLYDFAGELNATVVRTSVSRTVIDMNRDPNGISLYPGQITTDLCPTETFDGDPLYVTGREPKAQDIAARIERFHTPYREALEEEIARLKALHPAVVVYDCHAIRSRFPRLFEGELPVMNIGTNSGASCSPALRQLVEHHCAVSGFSHVSDGRFKGGWITRHFGDPARGVHALQMELAFRGYLQEPVTPADPWPVPYDEHHALRMRTVLKAMLGEVIAWSRHVQDTGAQA